MSFNFLLTATSVTLGAGFLLRGVPNTNDIKSNTQRGWSVWDIVATSRFKAAVGLGVATTVTKKVRFADGHHTIPIYLCGAKLQQLSHIDQKAHASLHRGLKTVEVALHSAEDAADRMVPLGSRRTDPILSLAQSESGRSVIANAIHGYYSTGGWLPRGVPPISFIFPVEKKKYVSGISTSLSSECHRKIKPVK